MSHVVPLECLESVCIHWYYILKYKVSSSRSLYAYIIHIAGRLLRVLFVTLFTKTKCIVKI